MNREVIQNTIYYLTKFIKPLGIYAISYLDYLHFWFRKTHKSIQNLKKKLSLSLIKFFVIVEFVIKEIRIIVWNQNWFTCAYYKNAY